jgi:imidazolonepropionase-like amidohydrolase
MNIHGFAVLVASVAVVPAVSQDLVLTGALVLRPDGSGFEQRTVVVSNGRIHAADEGVEGSQTVDLDGLYLVPGLIELHSHLLLHPYDETTWDDQVLRESLELRTIRGTVAARATLEAGFTTIRDLGTEGAGFADVALRDAVASGMIAGPRIFAATRAIVATGCYGPSGFDPRWNVPKGAQVADGIDGVRKAVREQVAAGADWIKVYADYRRKPGGGSTPTFSAEELAAIVDEATTAGLPVAAHAVTAEAIRRSVLAGVKTIEHGYQASDDVLALMRERGVVLCPTLAACEAIGRYSGGAAGAARRLNPARATFLRAMKAGVTIGCGSDVGVFAHGDSVRELELMVEFGMSAAAALRSATAIASDVLGLEAGRIVPGRHADLVAVRRDPLESIGNLRDPTVVIQAGKIVVERR